MKDKDMNVASLDDRASKIQGEATKNSIPAEHSRSTINSELVVADGSCTHIKQLLDGCQASVLWLQGDQDPFLAISQALADRAHQGAPIQTLHWVSHGSPGQLHIGDRSITTAALIAHAQQLKNWGVKDLAIWSCSVGSDPTFISVLEELTGATVWASKQPLGRLADGSNHWQLANTCQKEAPVLPINASRQLAWNHQLAAPTLDSSVSPLLAAIDANTGAPSGAVGTLVSALIDSGGSLNNFSDADSDAPAIAITGTNLAGGTLYYSTDNGSNWSDVGTVSDTSARVLYADSNTRLAFKPATDYIGTISDLITFKAWDRSGPISPSLTSNYDSSGFASDGTFRNPGYATDVALSADGNTAFVTDGTSGLDIVRINDLASPFLRSTYGKDGSRSFFTDITLSADGNTAFIADAFQGLHIADLSDRFSNPTFSFPADVVGSLISSTSFSGGGGLIRDLTVSSDGNTAFVALGFLSPFDDGGPKGSLSIIDVSDLSSPTVIGSYNLPGFGRSVTLSADGDTAFIADGPGGVQIVDISKPTANSSPIIDTTREIHFSNTTDTAQITVVPDLPAPLTNFADSSRKQINQLSVDDIKRVLISEISNLSPKAVKGFTSNQISVLSENVFTGLSAIQLSRLTKDAVTGLQRGQLKTLNGVELSAFKPKTLKLFPVDAITGLRPNSLNSLSKRQVRAFADDQLAGLNKRQIQKADVFIDSLSRQQKNNLLIGFNSKSRFTIDLLNTVDDDLTLLSAVDPLA